MNTSEEDSQEAVDSGVPASSLGGGGSASGPPEDEEQKVALDQKQIVSQLESALATLPRDAIAELLQRVAGAGSGASTDTDHKVEHKARLDFARAKQVSVDVNRVGSLAQSNPSLKWRRTLLFTGCASSPDCNAWRSNIVLLCYQ